MNCDGNEHPDFCDLRDCAGSAWCSDCNGNGILDGCDVDPNDPDHDGEVWQDCIDGGPNGRPDECECLGDVAGGGDGQINLGDLQALLSNYGMSPAEYRDGDLNCDGIVDLEDLQRLLSDYGSDCSSP